MAAIIYENEEKKQPTKGDFQSLIKKRKKQKKRKDKAITSQRLWFSRSQCSKKKRRDGP